MYRKQQHEQREFEAFHLSFGGRLSSRNRWVRLAKLIPWDRIESRYAAGFRSSGADRAHRGRQLDHQGETAVER